MIQPIKSTIRANLSAEAYYLEGDKSLFDKIVADQEKYSGPLRPAPNWDLEIGGHQGNQYFNAMQTGQSITAESYSDEQYFKKFSSLQKMMDPFVGVTGLQGVNQEVIQEYYDYLLNIDHLQILPNYFEPNGDIKGQANGLLITDLGSIVDVNLISAFLNPAAGACWMLEVGGGYGRLAEVFLNMYADGDIKYVLLDAVPAALMYAYLYLSKIFPHKRIGSYYKDDPFDMELFDCYIMPAWHFDASAFSGSFDCCINIQSMQEMNQYHIDYYLEMFNRLLKGDSGIAYISNEKDYIFRGEWNYPANWRLLLKTRTPRSWTRNSPTEIFLKGADSFETQNRMIDFLYSLQLKGLDKNSEQHNSILHLESELQKSQQESSGLRLELQENQLELQKSQKDISILRSILSRMPLSAEELTIDKTEESIRNLYHYYSSPGLPEGIRLFENISKINAHLVAVNLYLRRGAYRRALSHMARVVERDILILFSIQTIKIIGNGVLFHLRRTQKG